MPDQVVILFMFAVVTSFGIIWVSNEMRLRFQARYLEYCFYFTLITVTYGFVNWIAPFIVLYLTDEAGSTNPVWSVAVFVLIGVPLLLAKLYFFFLMFQELLARKKPMWLNKISLGASVIVLLLTVWSVKTFYDGRNVEQVRHFIYGLGIAAVLIEFLIMIHYLFAARGNAAQVLGRFATPFGLLFLIGFIVYVLAAYSAFLPLGQSALALTPYLYFIINGLPIVALWIYHQSQPVPVLSADAPRLTRFIEDNALTPREADILKKIIRGASNKEIAEQSFISPHTVRNHIYNIYRKTGIRNRFQLLALFQED
jgi:DNA-binding CsgD family transcriptional regulator